jgi:hypothetical protein
MAAAILADSTEPNDDWRKPAPESVPPPAASSQSAGVPGGRAASDLADLVRESLWCFARFDELLDQDNRGAADAYILSVLVHADQFIAAHGEAAAGLIAKGLALARKGNFQAGADCFMGAVHRDACGIREAAISRLIDECASYYSTLTFMAPDRLGIQLPPGLKELISALQKTLIMADREVELSGARARELVERAYATRPAREEPTKACVQCPACREDLKGHVARCPHCTSILNWMNCPQCKQVVATRVTMKFVGAARGGHRPVYHCIRCGRKLAGPDCFIATAAYGSHQEPNVVLLRSFRDRVMVKSRLGRGFVAVYYRVSPGLAARIRDNPAARRVVRWFLSPLVWVVRAVMW